MARGGVQICKIPVYWQRVEPSAGSAPVWTTYDAIFTAAASAGVRLLPLLHGSAPWVNANFQRPPLGPAWKQAAWQHFVQEFAARYGHGGEFWRQHPLLPALPPQYWEVWNEPNLRYFWGGRPQPAKYLNLLRITSQALRAADPQALVTVGGLFQHARQGFGTPASVYLNSLYGHPGAKSYFDAVALHPYASRPSGVVQNVKLARRVMRQHHDSGTPVVITELGWAVGGAGLAQSPFRATLGQQAHRLTKAFRLLSARPSLGLNAILWFSWRDGLENLWIYRMGLFGLDGRPRPSWYAFARAAGGTP
jgi:hypothetical protein